MKPTAKDFAKYYGCKCRYRERRLHHPKFMEWQEGDINGNILSRMSYQSFECQLIGRRLRDITEEEALVLGKLFNDEVYEWRVGYYSHQVLISNSVYHFSICFDWLISVNIKSYCEVPCLADWSVIVDKLRDMGFIEERYFELGWAIESTSETSTKQTDHPTEEQ